MLVISILEAEDFGEELYSVMRDHLTSYIKTYHVGLIVAAGDSKGMIYQLLSELALEYPHIFCTILLSNDKLAYEDPEAGCPYMFSLDGDIVYGDPRNAKKRRREKLIESSDVVFCRPKRCNGIRKINGYCDIVVI